MADFNDVYYVNNDGSVCVCKDGDYYATIDGKKGWVTFDKTLRVDLSKFRKVKGIINDINSTLEAMCLAFG